jgi:hypothetical protein
VLHFAASGLAFAEPVVVERDSALLSEPRNDATVVANLKSGVAGDATVKKGAWVNVKTAAGTGWILSFNLRYGAAAAGGSGPDASTISRLAAPRQKLNVTSTIGVRGIESEDLKQAQFSASEMKQFEQYHTTAAQAKSTASASGLRAVSVDYLDKR